VWQERVEQNYDRTADAAKEITIWESLKANCYYITKWYHLFDTKFPPQLIRVHRFRAPRLSASRESQTLVFFILLFIFSFFISFQFYATDTHVFSGRVWAPGLSLDSLVLNHFLNESVSLACIDFDVALIRFEFALKKRFPKLVIVGL